VCGQFIYFLSCRVVSVWHLVYRECGETPSNTLDHIREMNSSELSKCTQTYMRMKLLL